MDAAATLDQRVRRCVYDTCLKRGLPPSRSELAESSGASPALILESLARLAAARVLVLQPESGEILMAPPYSAVPTPFVVRSRHAAYANCAWDALGVSVMQHEPVEVHSACACCGEALTVTTRSESTPLGDALIHFAVPARHWWDDIVFT
jgi:hypothetical protein